VIMLGGKEISTVSLSPLIPFQNLSSLDLELMFSQLEIYSNHAISKDGKLYIIPAPIRLCDLPGFARIQLNLYLLEEDKLKSSSLRTGYVLGSASFSIFE